MALKDPRSIIDGLMLKYGIPEWVKPYVYRYIKGNPIHVIKHATSFVEFKRAKGEVTRSQVKLPNGLKFDIKFVMHILDMFYYGEERISSIYASWASERVGVEDHEYPEHFSELSMASQAHARAVKNLIEGLGNKLSDPSKEAKDVFDCINSIKDWKHRVIMSGVILRRTYGIPFGYIFYKVFYPTAPEFMRSFGKVFERTSSTASWGEEESKRIISSHMVDEPALMGEARKLLALIYKSISAELPYAKEQHIEPEIKLLMELAIAYPIHALKDFGMRIDIEEEIGAVKRLAKRSAP